MAQCFLANLRSMYTNYHYIIFVHMFICAQRIFVCLCKHMIFTCSFEHK